MGVTAEAAKDWSGTRILVTGAAGFLGKWVAERLTEAGAHVVGLDIAWAGDRANRPPAGLVPIEGDVRDAGLIGRILEGERIETVIHLAAQTLVGPAVVDPVETFEHNIAGTWSTLEACRRAPSVRSVVVASSDKAYGDAGGRPYREEMALRARHPYDVSKAAADMLAQTYANTYDLPVVVTRCGNMYGGGDLSWSRIVPGTVRSALAGERPVIRSDGSLIRDYLYVEDAAEGVLVLARAVADRPALRGEAFNFAAGARLSVLDIVGHILRAMNADLEPVIEGRDLPEIPEQRVSASRARRILGWRATTSIDEGLGRTIAWYRRFLGG